MNEPLPDPATITEPVVYKAVPPWGGEPMTRVIFPRGWSAEQMAEFMRELPATQAKLYEVRH